MKRLIFVANTLIIIFSCAPKVSSQPAINITPDSLFVELLSGTATNQTLTIGNMGDSNLSWNLVISGLSDLRGVKILFDQAHNGVHYFFWLSIIGELERLGATIDLNATSIVESALNDVDVVWLVDQDNFWTTTEVSALTNWVNNGGGLLMEGDESQHVFNPILSALAAGFIYFPPFSPAEIGISTDIALHVTTIGVDSFFVRSQLSHLRNITSPAGVLIKSLDGLTNTVYSHSGNGRIIAMADENFSNLVIDSVDNKLFAKKAVDWLAQVPPFVSVTSESSLVIPGSFLDLVVTIDADGLNGGDYFADLVFISNDPVEPQVKVPIHLHVTGVPDIVVSPDSIDFGPSIIGTSTRDSLVFENIGSDLLTIFGINSNNSDFTVDSSSFSLSPGGRLAIRVTFAPTIDGVITGLLYINTNDPDMPTVTVFLKGLGLLAPEIDLSPLSFTADLLLTVMPVKIETLTVFNRGGSDLIWGSFIKKSNSVQRSYYTLNTPFFDSNSFFLDKDNLRSTSFPLGRSIPIDALLYDLSGVNIMLDQSHGGAPSSNWQTLIGDLESRGAIVTLNASTISITVLQNVDVLWLLDQSILWTINEIEALSNWVKAGGGLLLEGDNPATVNIYNEMLTYIGAGIIYSEENSSTGFTTDIFAHETTIDVDSIFISFPRARLFTVGAPASVLIKDIKGVANTAYSLVGKGRIIAMADQNFLDIIIGLADNQLFANQVFDWLANSVDWLSVSPANGAIAPGDSTMAAVTIDASELQNGEYSAKIHFFSNDPITTEPEVTVDINVLEFLCGDANADGVVDQFDFEYLFQTYFYRGPSSMPANSTDLNCNNKIDLADIIILSKYLNGSTTIDCCNGSLFSKQSVSLEIKVKQQSSSFLK